MAPVMFQDDLANWSDSLENAKESSRRVDVLTKQLCLDLNKDKTVYILIGSKKQKKETRRQLKNEPLCVGNLR